MRLCALGCTDTAMRGQVAALVPLLDKDLADRRRTSEVDVSALVAGSYGSLIGRLCKQRLKHVPVAFHAAPPERLFDGHEQALPGFVLQ